MVSKSLLPRLNSPTIDFTTSEVRMPCDTGRRQIDHRLHLRRLTALPDQRQTRIRGQIQLASLTDFKARHDQLVKRDDATFSQIIRWLCLIYGK